MGLHDVSGLIAHQRYAHAKQYKRARRQLRKLKTYLRRTIGDIGRKIEGDETLRDAFRQPLWLGQRVMTQQKRDPRPKVYALHAPEVECRKARRLMSHHAQSLQRWTV